MRRQRAEEKRKSEKFIYLFKKEEEDKCVDKVTKTVKRKNRKLYVMRKEKDSEIVMW